MDNLFVENERVVLDCETNENKLFYIILIVLLFSAYDNFS